MVSEFLFHNSSQSKTLRCKIPVKYNVVPDNIIPSSYFLFFLMLATLVFSRAVNYNRWECLCVYVLRGEEKRGMRGTVSGADHETLFSEEG